MVHVGDRAMIFALWLLLIGPFGTIMLLVTAISWLRVWYWRRRLRRFYRYGY